MRFNNVSCMLTNRTGFWSRFLSITRQQGRGSLALTAADSGRNRAPPNGPHRRSGPAPARDARTSTAPTGTADSRRLDVRVMAAKENGRAGQEWPPCPNTVTSSAAARPFGVRSLRRFHRAGSQWSSPGAALRFVSGSRVATVMPDGTSSGPCSRSKVTGASVKRAMMERCAMRVDSRAQVSARRRVAEAHLLGGLADAP